MYVFHGRGKPTFKMAIIYLDGIPVELINPDLDNDGIVGGVEKITQRTPVGVQPINTPTELGESLKELNEDHLDKSTNMSGIDMRARLGDLEIPPVLALDSLVSMNVLPNSCLPLTRSKKRLSVSLSGKGREEIVEIVGGKREHEAKSGFGGMIEGIKNKFGGGIN